jgi:hypothetical protein
MTIGFAPVLAPIGLGSLTRPHAWDPRRAKSAPEGQREIRVDRRQEQGWASPVKNPTMSSRSSNTVEHLGW